MQYSKESFIRLAIQYKALKFGRFTLKSGRISPYFFNAGLFYDGNALRQLGFFYAHVILNQGIEFQHLFGPAYKGISLASATAIALTELGVNATVTFNRKEVKQHGEQGMLIGAPLAGKTIIVDDVITAGTAFKEAQSFIKAQQSNISGVIVALDRCERGLDNGSAIQNIRAQGIPVHAIISFFDLLSYLQNNNQYEQAESMQNYQKEYGALN